MFYLECSGSPARTFFLSERAVDVVFRSVVATLLLELRTALTSSGLDDPGILLAYPRIAEDELRAQGLGIGARSSISSTITTHPSFSPSLVPSTIPIITSVSSPSPSLLSLAPVRGSVLDVCVSQPQGPR